MKKEYNSPEAEIDFFNILSSKSVITTSFGWEEEDESPYSLKKSKEIAWE